MKDFGETARSIVDEATDVVLADVEVAYSAIETRNDLLEDIEAVDRELYDSAEPDVASTAGYC